MWNKISERMDKLEARIYELEVARDAQLVARALEKRGPGRPPKQETTQSLR
jgi:hypothetical protein